MLVRLGFVVVLFNVSWFVSVRLLFSVILVKMGDGVCRCFINYSVVVVVSYVVLNVVVLCRLFSLVGMVLFSC